MSTNVTKRRRRCRPTTRQAGRARQDSDDIIVFTENWRKTGTNTKTQVNRQAKRTGRKQDMQDIKDTHKKRKKTQIYNKNTH